MTRPKACVIIAVPAQLYLPVSLEGDKTVATNQDLTKLLNGRTIDSVRQRETELDIDLTDGSTLSIKLAASTQSVTLTSSNDKTEYSK